MNFFILSLLIVTIATPVLLFVIHLGFRAPRQIEQGSPLDFGLEYRAVNIPTNRGEQLFAWLLPAAPSAPTIIILHGWGGNAELMLPLALPFHRSGMNVLLLDARNHGRSDSSTFSSLPRFAEDIGSATDWVKGSGVSNSEKIVLLGHSVGAGAALFEASRRDDIGAVISISAFAHPEWMMRRHMQKHRIPNFVISLVLRYVEWVIGHPFREIAPLNTIRHVKCPVLLVHGNMDETVPVSDAMAIQKNCSERSVQLLLIDDAGHDSVEKVEEHGEQLVAFLKPLSHPK